MKYKHTDPPQYAGGYTLHLYCDHENDAHEFNEFPKEFFAESFAQCARAARLAGWVIHRSSRTATCPKCSGK